MIDIQDNQALAEMCEEASKQPFIAFDTEFIRERTYYPILALVQVSWLDRTPVLIDPLPISDWSPFHRILANPDIVKVFHAGRQDLEIFYHQMGELPQNLFDTQIAASMCGLGDQIGYSGLVERLVGVQLVKGSSYTNWLQRPLSEAQLKYAADDVLYLPALYKRLLKKAGDKKRLEWILSEMKNQLHVGLFEPDPDELWRKVKKANSLKSKNLVVLRALARWRFDLARKFDKPMRFIFSDEVMVEIAKIEKLTVEHLRSRRGVQSRMIDRHGEELVELHSEARKVPKEEWPVAHDSEEKPPSDKSEALADLAWMLVKEIARRHDMAPTHLSNKKELAGFIEAHHRGGELDKFEVGQGWRWDMVGQALIDLIEGQLVIRVRGRRIVWEKTDSVPTEGE